MKFKVSKLGAIDSMTIDFSKSFTLFCGNNGTGKTYATSFIYTMIWWFGGSIYQKIENSSHPLSESLSAMEGELDPDVLYDHFSMMLKNERLMLLEALGLGVEKRHFSCEIVTTKEEWRRELYTKSLPIPKMSGVSFKKNSYAYKTYLRLSESDRLTFYKTAFLLSLVFDGVYGAHMFPAERNGVYTFSRELVQARLRSMELSSMFRYPRPIADSIANVEGLKERKDMLSPYCALADEIERDILHGVLGVTDEGEIQFQIGRKKLSINQVSSTVKTLASLVFYLRHMAGQQNMLLIDEPELNLHPMNQILLVRILVKMMNGGIHIIMSTHSDYMIREINNAIMGMVLSKHDEDILTRYNYGENMLLDKERFAAYHFRENKGTVSVDSLSVTDYGFEMPSIDFAIKYQNEVNDLFYDLLKYKYKVV